MKLQLSAKLNYHLLLDPIKMKTLSKSRQVVVGILIAAIFALIFFAYLQPEFIVDLANRYVFC
jgi:uncharacterized membrane protein YgaE (UPF0421/DUF939 family)